MPSKFIDFIVTGEPATAKATVERALVDRTFVVSWDDQWTGTARRGSKILNIFGGALAQYFKVGINIMSTDAGLTTVRISRESSGMSGGAIGVTRTNKNMDSLREELRATFSAAGVLRRISEE
jgi:hypothetical protein